MEFNLDGMPPMAFSQEPDAGCYEWVSVSPGSTRSVGIALPSLFCCVAKARALHFGPALGPEA